MRSIIGSTREYSVRSEKLNEIFKSRGRRLYLICLVFVICLAGSVTVRAQEHFTATCEPIRFKNSSGDIVYFTTYIPGCTLTVWKDRWLIFLDFDKYYIADTQTLRVSQIGRYGGGPGEYRVATGNATRGDTLTICHDGCNMSEYLLPSGKFIRRTRLQSNVPGGHPLWDSDGQFYSTELPLYRREEGLIGRYSREGELLQIIGEFDQMERYGDMRRDLIFSMNSGYLSLTQAGDLAFVYGYQPIVLVFSPQGELKKELTLEMPWNDRQFPNPVHRPKYGYAARELIHSMQVFSDGFMVACRGFKKRDGIMKNIVAKYSWDGDLMEIIHLPPLPETESLEDFLHGAVKVGGEIWVVLYGDPAFRKLRISAVPSPN